MACRALPGPPLDVGGPSPGDQVVVPALAGQRWRRAQFAANTSTSSAPVPRHRALLWPASGGTLAWRHGGGPCQVEYSARPQPRPSVEGGALLLRAPAVPVLQLHRRRRPRAGSSRGTERKRRRPAAPASASTIARAELGPGRPPLPVSSAQSRLTEKRTAVATSATANASAAPPAPGQVALVHCFTMHLAPSRHAAARFALKRTILPSLGPTAFMEHLLTDLPLTPGLLLLPTLLAATSRALLAARPPLWAPLSARLLMHVQIITRTSQPQAPGCAPAAASAAVTAPTKAALVTRNLSPSSFTTRSGSSPGPDRLGS